MLVQTISSEIALEESGGRGDGEDDDDQQVEDEHGQVEDKREKGNVNDECEQVLSTTCQTDEQAST